MSTESKIEWTDATWNPPTRSLVPPWESREHHGAETSTIFFPNGTQAASPDAELNAALLLAVIKGGHRP